MDDRAVKSEIAENWNEKAEYYDTHVSHGIQTREETLLWMNALQSVLPPKDNLSILDVGCGTGVMGMVLAEMGHTVTGIDISEEMMNIGRKKAMFAHLSMIFHHGDAEHPPFMDNTFDVVINRHLLWTLPHLNNAIASWYRVLKPTGVVMVIDGVWDDGSVLSDVRRKMSFAFSRMFELHPHGEKGYSTEICNVLPNRGGVPASEVHRYLEIAGFSEVSVLNLDNICVSQRQRLNWYQRINPSPSYYLVSGWKGGAYEI
ncbi:MAG: class I SAM-dependent methyltransferase [Methanocalculaceae archaeon]|jgi:ubiquinone/menaquinone biosynthesis C-methylase UbiE|nr:class I SAM-dependent methyltransferase [Methanocalculaceae archaeon]